ncbi:hypothetical protein BgiBS90_030519 [Biomphalaria glabrata]|nr:hypothetical protein BgiBS90_030519 [Biomphalaria glabrata]
MFKNSVMEEKLSLTEAIKAGYLITDSAIQNEDSIWISIILEDIKFKVLAANNLYTGQDITLGQGIKDESLIQIMAYTKI